MQLMGTNGCDPIVAPGDASILCNGRNGVINHIPPDPQRQKYCLILVRERQPQDQAQAQAQVQPQDEPDLWSLFVSRAKGQPGSVYRVRGDVVNMHFEQAHDVNPLDSDLLKDAYTIAMLSDEEAQAVHRFAGLEAPPSAPDRRSAKENCQGWTARLLQRLALEGFLSGHQLETIGSIVDPVP